LSATFANQLVLDVITDFDVLITLNDVNKQNTVKDLLKKINNR